MKSNTRTFVRLFFLFLIFILWIMNKIEIWLVFLLAGLLIIPFFGRIYCGWICPVFTTLDIFSPILKKPVLHKFNNFENRFLKVVIFIIFLLMFILIKRLDLSIPFFILLIPIGLLITVLFGSAQWHRMCPFGTIFSLLGRFSTKGYNFISDDCSKCGLCAKKCENNCLVFREGKTLYIERKHCLVCGKCKEACPQDNISFVKLYSNLSKKQD